MGESGSTAVSKLVELVNAIPTAREGEIITADYHNSLRTALLEIVDQIENVPATTSAIKTGIVKSSQFDRRFELLDGRFQATEPQTHGLGAVRVAMIVGVIANPEIGDRLGLEKAELYNISNLQESSIQIFAAVTPSSGTFALIASRETLDRFDGFRWWAFKAG